jgi:hypothetical protein
MSEDRLHTLILAVARRIDQSANRRSNSAVKNAHRINGAFRIPVISEALAG